jgi:hypothetical protein
MIFDLEETHHWPLCARKIGQPDRRHQGNEAGAGVVNPTLGTVLDVAAALRTDAERPHASACL